MFSERPDDNPFDERRALHYDDWFDSAAGSLARELQSNTLRQLIDPQEGESVLDVGCGTGESFKHLAALGVRCTGLDRSAAMLAVAAEKFLDTPLLLGDACALPFADRAFDIVVLNTTLEFVADPARAVREAARVARRCIYVGILNRWSMLGLHRRIESKLGDSLYAHAHLLTLSEATHLLGDSGVFNVRWAGVPFLPDPLSRWSLLQHAARAAGKVPNPFAAYIGCAADVGVRYRVRLPAPNLAAIPGRAAVASLCFKQQSWAA